MKTEYRFGLKIREFRIDRGWTQEQLAENADLSTRTVQRAEKDQTQDPETLAAIAAAFKVTVRDLRTKYWVTESKPPKSRLIESAEGFRTVIQRGYHYYSHQSLVMPRPEAEARVSELCEEISRISGLSMMSSPASFLLISTAFASQFKTSEKWEWPSSVFRSVVM